MIEFIRGPLVWIAFALFFGGCLYKLITVVRLAHREKTVIPTMSARFGLRSVLHWITPFGSHTMRQRPVFTALSFLFHASLLITPLFAMGHAALWEESWGLHWWSLPPGLADLMTAVVVAVGLLLLLRRGMSPEVRYVTTWKDVAVLLLVISPFLTGFISARQWFDHETTMALHILSGAAWLIAIPFTRLSHMLWFVLSRAYMGSEFGAVRHSRDW